MTGFFDFATQNQRSSREKLVDKLLRSPIPASELHHNLGLFMTPANVSRALSLHKLYLEAKEVHGDILDLGTRWGQNIALFNSFRSIYEPYNRFRRITAFDTFTGFPSTNAHDGPKLTQGSFSTAIDYVEYLKEVLECHDEENVPPQQGLISIVQGDAVETLQQYLNNYPSTIVSLAFFDFDIYEPTKQCLEMIKPHLVKGSILAFDEANDRDCPGETIALREVLDMSRFSLLRAGINSRISYIRF